MGQTEPQTSQQGKPKLVEQVRTLLRTRRYSIRTEKAYLDWIRRFILFHGKRHPAEMGEEEIAQFLTYLETLSGQSSGQSSLLTHLVLQVAHFGGLEAAAP